MSSPNIVLILQARMGSTRLLNKMMLDLAGKPLIVRVLERVKRASLINKIVLAIPDTQSNNVLEQIAKEYGVECFRGSENDLVDRYYQAAVKFNADIIARLPADNPIPEWDEYDRIVRSHLASDNDFSSNIYNFMGNEYPDGIGVEVFNFDSLEYIWKNVKNPANREHIATNFYDYLNQRKPNHTNFKVGTVKCPADIRRPDLVFDVNTHKEYLFIKHIYEYFMPASQDFTISQVINWYDNIYKKQ